MLGKVGSINSDLSYNTYLTALKQKNVNVVASSNPISMTSKPDANVDTYQFSNSSGNTQLKAVLSSRVNAVTADLKEAEDNNGFIGKAWSWTKNTFGFGAGSNKVKKSQSKENELLANFDQDPKGTFEQLTGVPYSDENVEKFINGEIKLKSEQNLDGYKEGQEMCVDTVGDIVSGFVALGAVAAAPFTGGVSLLLAAGTGALVKTGVKYADAKSAAREYDSFARDMATGAFSGFLAPLTGGAGGAVGKALATRLGLEAVQIGAKSVAVNAGSQVAKQGIKQGLKTMLANPTGYTYAGGNILKRGVAYGAEMMTDGALGGAVDNAFRTAYDGGSLEDVLSSAKEGFVGGALLSPVIGGGFKVVGHAGSHLSKKAFKDINFTGIESNLTEVQRKALDKLNNILPDVRILSGKLTKHKDVRVRKPNNVRECFETHVNRLGIDLNSGQISGGHNSAFYPDLFIEIAGAHEYKLKGNPLKKLNDALKNIDTLYNRASGNYRVRRVDDRVIIEFEFTSRDGVPIYREMNADGSFNLPKKDNPLDSVSLPSSEKLINVYKDVKQAHIDNLTRMLGFDVNTATFSDIRVNVDDNGVINVECIYKHNGSVKSYKFTPVACDEPGLKVYKQHCNGEDFATPKTSCDVKLLEDITKFFENSADNFTATHIILEGSKSKLKPESNIYLFRHEGITFQTVINDSGEMVSFYPVTREFVSNTYNFDASEVFDLTNIINMCNNTERKVL